MNATTVTTTIAEAQAIGDEILTTIATVVPGTAVPDALAQKLLDLVSKYAQLAITSYSAASGLPINPTTVAALMPNQTPVVAPPATPGPIPPHPPS